MNSRDSSTTERPPFAFGPRETSLAIVGLSVLTLAVALALEHIGGFLPCPLCLEERIAYYAAVPVGLIAFFLSGSMPLLTRGLLGVLAVAFVFNAGLGAYHAGVEWHWWYGPDECTGIGTIATNTQELLRSLGNVKPVVRCDEVPFRILGLSLAGYGALLSAFLAFLAALATLGIDLAVQLFGLLRSGHPHLEQKTR